MAHRYPRRARRCPPSVREAWSRPPGEGGRRSSTRSRGTAVALFAVIIVAGAVVGIATWLLASAAQRDRGAARPAPGPVDVTDRTVTPGPGIDRRPDDRRARLAARPVVQGQALTSGPAVSGRYGCVRSPGRRPVPPPRRRAGAGDRDARTRAPDL